MYIQITDKCNLKCAHCGFSCTDQGTFMDEKIFLKCCKLAKNYGHDIFLGGGEPTLHPQFIGFLGLAILYGTDTMSGLNAGVITNGTNEELTLRLLNTAKSGFIYCGVSIDKWHDKRKVSKKVIELAQKYNMIHDVKTPVSVGRAKNLSYATKIGECMCNDLFVDPTGHVYSCGCKKKFVGHIRETKKIQNYLQSTYGDYHESESASF